MFFWWSSGSSRGSAAAFLLIALIVGFIFSLFLGASTPWLRMVTIIVPVFFLVLPFVLYVMQGGKKGQGRSNAVPAEQAEKPKRGESLAELMSILNDEDIDDLRARVKMRLEEQIDNAGIGEMETFADLLAEAKRKHGDR